MSWIEFMDIPVPLGLLLMFAAGEALCPRAGAILILIVALVVFFNGGSVPQ